MASSRASTSAISLEDWEALAPLDDGARASIALVTEACSEKPLPAKLARHGPAPQASQANTPGRSATPAQQQQALNGTHYGVQNLLRRAASRVDARAGLARDSAASTPSGTPRPQSPVNGYALQQQQHRHARTQSTATVSSALAMQLHPQDHSGSLTPSRRAAGTRRPNPASLHDPLEITAPLETAQQFLEWFSGVEASMESEQEEVFRRYEAELDAYIDSCEEAAEMLEDGRGLIKEMEANYRFVEENSRALQSACETMLDEQKHLLEVTEAIDARLEYFRELDAATRALSQPGDTVVLQDGFLSMLERLNVCLGFMRANRDYRDAEVYSIRFQQCLTRAMTLIKMHFLSVLNAVAVEVGQRIDAATSTGAGGKPGPTDLSETALNALLYAKFSSIDQTTRDLLNELEKRAVASPEEYGNLLQECFAAWFGARTQLLSPHLNEEVRRMGPQTTELVKLTRSGCAYIREICATEWELFRTFFPSSGQTELYQYLETLCDHLYDLLRPRILHETKLEVLCELCNVLQALISLDGDSEDDEREEPTSRALASDDSDGESQHALVLPHGATEMVGVQRGDVGPHKLQFGHLLGTVLQDTQTRLVFRAQYIVEAEVLHWAPGPADLDYPARLAGSGPDKGKRKAVPSLSQWQQESPGNNAMGIVEVDGIPVFRLPPDEILDTWYPTLKKTLWILSRLHSYVNPAIFEDFAGEAVNLCRQSLTSASEKISAQPSSTKVDGHLFVIRHLLILKEVVRRMDLVQVERAMDFTSMTDALSSLLRNTTALFNPNTLYQLASKGMPSFAETMRDAKHDLDGSLKVICEDFMTQSSLLVSAPIRAFLTRCQAFLTAVPAGSPTPDLTAQAWASNEEVLKLHDAFVAEGDGGMEVGLREVLEKMNLYLDEEKTVAVLVPPTLGEVLEHYTTFYNLIRSEYDFSTANALVPPARIRERLKAIAGSTSAGWIKGREG